MSSYLIYYNGKTNIVVGVQMVSGLLILHVGVV